MSHPLVPLCQCSHFNFKSHAKETLNTTKNFYRYIFRTIKASSRMVYVHTSLYLPWSCEIYIFVFNTGTSANCILQKVLKYMWNVQPGWAVEVVSRSTGFYLRVPHNGMFAFKWSWWQRDVGSIEEGSMRDPFSGPPSSPNKGVISWISPFPHEQVDNRRGLPITKENLLSYQVWLSRGGIYSIKRAQCSFSYLYSTYSINEYIFFNSMCVVSTRSILLSFCSIIKRNSRHSPIHIESP